MGRRATKRGLCCIPIALLWIALLAPASQAETRTFLSTQHLFLTQDAATDGPASAYPSTIALSGLSGTVTKATVTVLGFSSASPDDVDMVITGPNGAQVMLMSDACGENPITLTDDNFTFDDSAPTFLSNNGPCGDFQEASFRPSNYLGNQLEPDDMRVNSKPGQPALPGPAPPYTNALSAFNGASPNGAWNLFVLDDNASMFNGVGTSGWALTLDIQPPPAPTPTPTVQAPTGLRDAALQKCKSKKTKKGRKKCKKKAQLLPL
jgi:hypothetical protein